MKRALILLLAMGCNNEQARPPETIAVEFATKIGLEPTRASCTKSFPSDFAGCYVGTKAGRLFMIWCDGERCGAVEEVTKGAQK